MAAGHASPTLPTATTLQVDPCVLTWMHEPDLACFDEKDASPYSLEVILSRRNMAELVSYELPPASSSFSASSPKLEGQTGLLPPLVRLHKGLIATIVAFEMVTSELRWLKPLAISIETQVS